MNRGILDLVKLDDTYKNSQKTWNIELLNIQMFWWEMIANGHDELDTRSYIFNFMKDINKQIKKNWKNILFTLFVQEKS